MVKSNRRRKLDRAKAEHKRAENIRRRAEAEIESEARRRVDALFQRQVNLQLSPVELTNLLLTEPGNIERVLVPEDARPASLQDRIRLLDAWPGGPPPWARMLAGFAAYVAGDESEARRQNDAFAEFLHSPAGQQWWKEVKERARNERPWRTDFPEIAGYRSSRNTYRIYLDVVAEARQRATEAALAAEDDVDGLSAAEFLRLLREYVGKTPAGRDPQSIARFRSRLTQPMTDFLFDEACKAVMGGIFALVIESLLERAKDRQASAP